MGEDEKTLGQKVTSTLRASKDNIAGGFLKGSRQDLANISSVHGSFRNISQKPAADQILPTNAIVYENTFIMRPEKKFRCEAARKIVEEILAANLTKMKYDAEKVQEVSLKIANETLAALKKLEFERYKYVVEVSIGEFKAQGVRVASRALWDTATDSFASASFKNLLKKK
ncbi:Tctex1 domain-containing protein 3 [Phlyctochytrium planicorne]|nr:Tctex1 domain-containing protein 3 [Phlyctochytrium planicorne]